MPASGVVATTSGPSESKKAWQRIKRHFKSHHLQTSSNQNNSSLIFENQHPELADLSLCGQYQPVFGQGNVKSHHGQGFDLEIGSCFLGGIVI